MFQTATHATHVGDISEHQDAPSKKTTNNVLVAQLVQRDGPLAGNFEMPKSAGCTDPDPTPNRQSLPSRHHLWHFQWCIASSLSLSVSIRCVNGCDISIVDTQYMVSFMFMLLSWGYSATFCHSHMPLISDAKLLKFIFIKLSQIQ